MIRLNKNDWRNFMKKLLIVVDYQKDFVNGSLGFKEAEDLDEYLASLIDQYHQNKDDVIFTFDTHQNNYLETQEGKNLPIEHCIKNSDGWELYGKVNTAKKEYDICISFRDICVIVYAWFSFTIYLSVFIILTLKR